MPMHKCENCETEVNWNGRKQRGRRCVGWIGSGMSKWKKKYDKQSGVAWWCPMCQKEKDLEAIKQLFPLIPASTAQLLTKDFELQRLNRN